MLNEYFYHCYFWKLNQFQMENTMYLHGQNVLKSLGKKQGICKFAWRLKTQAQKMYLPSLANTAT